MTSYFVAMESSYSLFPKWVQFKFEVFQWFVSFFLFSNPPQKTMKSDIFLLTSAFWRFLKMVKKNPGLEYLRGLSVGRVFDRPFVSAPSESSTLMVGWAGDGEGRLLLKLLPSPPRFLGVVGVSGVWLTCWWGVSFSTSLLAGDGFGET